MLGGYRNQTSTADSKFEISFGVPLTLGCWATGSGSEIAGYHRSTETPELLTSLCPGAECRVATERSCTPVASSDSFPRLAHGEKRLLRLQSLCTPVFSHYYCRFCLHDCCRRSMSGAVGREDLIWRSRSASGGAARIQLFCDVVNFFLLYFSDF